MFIQAIYSKGNPKYLSSDYDPLFRYHRWQANLRILEIEEIKSIPYTPTSHPFIERLIGTVSREYLDRMFFWNAYDLERKLEFFRQYYNRHRVHQALNGQSPEFVSGDVEHHRAQLNEYSWHSHCKGFFQTPMAA